MDELTAKEKISLEIKKRLRALAFEIFQLTRLCLREVHSPDGFDIEVEFDDSLQPFKFVFSARFFGGHERKCIFNLEKDCIHASAGDIFNSRVKPILAEIFLRKSEDLGSCAKRIEEFHCPETQNKPANRSPIYPASVTEHGFRGSGHHA